MEAKKRSRLLGIFLIVFIMTSICSYGNWRMVADDQFWLVPVCGFIFALPFTALIYQLQERKRNKNAAAESVEDIPDPDPPPTENDE